jgi:hypothetical protein
MKRNISNQNETTTVRPAAERDLTAHMLLFKSRSEKKRSAAGHSHSHWTWQKEDLRLGLQELFLQLKNLDLSHQGVVK